MESLYWLAIAKQSQEGLCFENKGKELLTLRLYLVREII